MSSSSWPRNVRASAEPPVDRVRRLLGPLARPAGAEGPSRAMDFDRSLRGQRVGRSGMLENPGRLRLAAGVAAEELATRREAVYRLCQELALIEPTMSVLRRAAQPLPTALGTLNAIHLATALMWQEIRGDAFVMATHDRALGIAARALGFPVIGI